MFLVMVMMVGSMPLSGFAQDASDLYVYRESYEYMAEDAYDDATECDECFEEDLYEELEDEKYDYDEVVHEYFSFSGLVMCAEYGIALEGAVVTLEGSEFYAVTDAYGFYNLLVYLVGTELNIRALIAEAVLIVTLEAFDVKTINVIDYVDEYGNAVIEIHRDAIEPGMRFIIVDDLLATGGTAKAASELVHEMGGKVVSQVFFIELAGLGGRGMLAGQDVKSVLKYN